LQVDSVTRATCNSTAELHLASNVIAGGNNPLNKQFIDNRGNAFVRFAEGEQQMDAFGLSRFTEPTQLAQYIHNYGTLPDDFQTWASGSGTEVGYSQYAQTIFMDVGTVSGSYIRRTSHKYHRYTAGQGLTIQMSVANGDTGKAGVTRRWGYYDTEDGAYFELSGSDLNLVLRTSSDGTTRETRVPSTEWNEDRLDGSGNAYNLSGMEIDPSKINVFWLDFAWLGAGRCRAGILAPDGDRIVCHTFHNANTNELPYMGTAVLPITTHIYNTATTASPSRLSFTCASVHVDGPVTPDLQRKSRKFSSGSVEMKSCPPGQMTPLISLRAAPYINGYVNRLVAVPEEFSLYVSGSPVVVCVKKNATMSGSSFIQKIDEDLSGPVSSSVEVSTSGLSFTNQGVTMLSWHSDVGSFSRAFPPNFNLKGESIFLQADGITSAQTYTLAAMPIGNVTASISSFVNWVDLG